ncbi:MAG: efflux RND transporter periplasmic adaptor subunit [Thiohalocapsa sp.]|nr:efflux RND transporter periplasmic adaptor subunit [Thiohalocapsa sp.]
MTANHKHTTAQPGGREGQKPQRSRASRQRMTVALVVSVILAGCQPSAPPPTETADISRPAEILEVTAATLRADLRFPGRVRAVQRVELAFNVPGQIVELPVVEGQAVAAGTLIARLDPASYETTLAAAQAELEAASAEYDRLRQLWEKSQAVPRAEVERKRTAVDVARSRFAATQKDLDDTRLTAPFGGLIARRLVENFQNVQAKEPVVSLQNPDALEIVIHVPERVVRSEPKRLAAFAVFADLPERRFPVTLKSFASEADPQTQTYEAVLGLSQPPDLRVLPGMAVEVLPDTATEQTTAVTGPADSVETGEGPAHSPTATTSDADTADTTPAEDDGSPQAAPAQASPVLIPLAAIVAAADGTPRVWVVDPQTSQVSQRPVETDAIQGSEVAVLSGLAPGEQIVTAGVHQLREGMRVHPLASER